MQKIAAFIVKKRRLLLVVMLALAVVCAALMPFVGINTDMTKYLPDSSQMKIGMDRMNEAFPNVAETYTIRVMFRGLDARDKLAIREQLAEIPNVDSVAYEPDSDDYNRGDATLYKLTTQYDYKSDEEAQIERDVADRFDGYDVSVRSDDTSTPDIPPIVFILSIVLVTTILLIACPSYFEPVLFLLTIGVAVLLTVFCIVKAIFAPVLLNKAASMAGIAVAHSVFNILCTAILLPCGDLLEKLAIRLVPDKAHAADKTVELDQRLLTTPAVALERCRVVTCEMAEAAVRALQNALRSFDHYTEALASAIREDESRCDHYEDVLGTYLVKLSAQKLGEQESEESAELLKAIGDFERISDHAVNVLESAEELREKGLAFSDEAKRELSVLSAAVNDILMRALDAFREQDMTAARQVEPLEQVIDDLKEQLRTRHILRMQQGQCSIEAGFVWSDLLTDLERTSDHCSNIAGCVIDAAHHDLNMHATLDAARRRDPDFREQYQRCAAKYQV